MCPLQVGSPCCRVLADSVDTTIVLGGSSSARFCHCGSGTLCGRVSDRNTPHRGPVVNGMFMQISRPISATLLGMRANRDETLQRTLVEHFNNLIFHSQNYYHTRPRGTMASGPRRLRVRVSLSARIKDQLSIRDPCTVHGGSVSSTLMPLLYTQRAMEHLTRVRAAPCMANPANWSEDEV